MNVKAIEFWPSLAYYLSFLAVLLIGYSANAQLGATVVGCGGFIRWHSPSVTSKIDYQKLKVNLYLSESDKLKDVTEVLPNGAFSVPLYDKGPYRLKLATPPGWYVTPADGYLLDLRTNPEACSSDFNFDILGFTVTGRVVTFGLDTGPSNLLVRLTSISDGSEIHTRTFAGGSFGVGPVVPGEYILTVSDGEQIVTENVRARQTVSVGATNVALHEAVVLLGHFVRGDVTDFDRRPLSGVTIYLLTTSSTVNIDCTRIPEAAKMNVRIPPPLIVENVYPACQTITDVSGQFSFNRLPGGEYILLPHHSLNGPEKSQSSVLLSFEPSSVRINVAHNDIQLDSPAFHTSAFQLPPGRLTWPNGQPIRGAKVFLGDSTEATTTSDHNGFYQVGFIQPGQFVIHVVAEDAEFANVTTNLSVVTKHLPNFEPIRFSVCGQLDATDDLLNGQYQFELHVQIKDLKSGSVSRVATQSHPHGFRFCALLNPGRYELLPDVRTKDNANQPVVFSPPSHFVEVSSGPVLNVTFSQFTAKVSGRVTCLVPCASAAEGSFVVRLSSIRDNNGPSIVRTVQPKFNSKADKTGDFEFDRVFPGAYRIAILSSVEDAAVPVDGWCWSSAGNSRVIRVMQNNLHWRDEPTLDFAQTGFTVRVIFDPPPMVLRNTQPELILSASDKVISGQQNDSSSNTQIHWKIGLHPTKVCLPSADRIYNLNVSSPCFKLSQPSPSQIRPARDCSPLLARSPLVRLTVAQLPLLIQLSHSHIFDPAGHSILTGTPMMVEVTHLSDPSTDKMIRKVMAQWSDYETGAVAPPVARTLIWIDTHQTVRIKPRMSLGVPGRWFYTQIVPADAAVINLSDAPENNAEAHTDLVEFAPPANLPSHNQPTTPMEFAHCSALYHSNLTVRFPLELGVTLCGKLIPPIEKVGSHLTLP
ncbi:hypothetical protein FBUS_07432 [Fasciolopsis buskii]|uniref:Nodal modulator 1 n=1 Tax=Fasciolopsis buskii TaxID=27845 RepID=A0A8E0RQR2_9TREM|nr:hypothetical protein FBUS_07432 [Fasciolopsis buski]